MGSHTAWYRVPHERARMRVRTRAWARMRACVRACARARGFVWVSQSPSCAAHVDYNRHGRWVSGGRDIYIAGHVPRSVRHHGAGLVRRAASPAREGGCSVTHIHFRHRCVTLVLVEESDEAIAARLTYTHRTVATPSPAPRPLSSSLGYSAYCSHTRTRARWWKSPARLLAEPSQRGLGSSPRCSCNPRWRVGHAHAADQPQGTAARTCATHAQRSGAHGWVGAASGSDARRVLAERLPAGDARRGVHHDLGVLYGAIARLYCSWLSTPSAARVATAVRARVCACVHLESRV